MKKSLKIMAFAVLALGIIWISVSIAYGAGKTRGNTDSNGNGSEIEKLNNEESTKEKQTEKTTEAQTEEKTEAQTEKQIMTVVNNYNLTGSEGLKYTSLGGGKCEVCGIGSCKDNCIIIPMINTDGETVVSISSGAFSGCMTVCAIQIPYTVTTIGDGAFGACDNLSYIAVDQANQYFISDGGVLMSADKSMIISYPAKLGSVSYTIPKTVKIIGTRAFYGCSYLKNINYQGSEAEWATINIMGMNYSLMLASISCSVK